jgi:hypothetical protein
VLPVNGPVSVREIARSFTAKTRDNCDGHRAYTLLTTLRRRKIGAKAPVLETRKAI